MKNAIIPSVVVGIVFVLILIIAGAWVYLSQSSSSGGAAGTASGVIQQMQRDQAQMTAATTTAMDTSASGGVSYQIAPGLEAQDVTEGTGTPVTNGETVSVKYTGTLPDGTVFDSTDLHGGTPFTFTLGGGQVIKGWDLGVVGMKPGGVRILTIAPSLGYGANDYGPIPGNSTLTFKVEMVGPANQ